MDVNQTNDSNFEFTKTIQNANISYLYVHTLQENSKFTTWHNVHFLKKERKSKKKNPYKSWPILFFQIEVMKILYISVFILFLVKGTIANACMGSTQEVEKGSAES